MANSLNLQPIATGVQAALLMAGVAALARGVAYALLSNPIPWKDKKRLSQSYGAWAVNLAESVCPHGDVTCVEREARRLYESRILRRR